MTLAPIESPSEALAGPQREHPLAGTQKVHQGAPWISTPGHTLGTQPNAADADISPSILILR